MTFRNPIPLPPLVCPLAIQRLLGVLGMAATQLPARSAMDAVHHFLAHLVHNLCPVSQLQVSQQMMPVFDLQKLSQESFGRLVKIRPAKPSSNMLKLLLICTEISFGQLAALLLSCPGILLLGFELCLDSEARMGGAYWHQFKPLAH